MARRVEKLARVRGEPMKEPGQERRLIRAILRERRQLIRGAPSRAVTGADPMDAAQEREEEAIWLAVLGRGRALQAQVDEALQRLALGRYGLCAACGEPISPARLMALPFAVRCLACQERLERGRGEGAASTSLSGG